MNMTPVVGFWFVLGIVTVGLALYRKLVSRHEDTCIHFSPRGEPLVANQVATARKLNLIDKCGETLTVITVVLGLLLAAVYLYNALLASGS
jgi:hypothetical protein